MQSQSPGAMVASLVGLGILGFLFFKLMKKKSNSQPLVRRPAILAAGNYVNAEEWDITWNKEGLPTKVVIHRNATRT